MRAGWLPAGLSSGAAQAGRAGATTSSAATMPSEPPGASPPSTPAREAELARRVRELLAQRLGLAPDQLSDDLALGEEGLCLDSVAVVELVLECERLVEGGAAPDLLTGGRLTVGALVGRVVAAAGVSE